MLLKLHYRTSTNELHSSLFILKVTDICKCQILSFVNDCAMGNCPPYFYNYFTTRHMQYNVRHHNRFYVKVPRTEFGGLACNILGAKMWNDLEGDIVQHKFKKSFKKCIIRKAISQY